MSAAIDAGRAGADPVSNHSTPPGAGDPAGSGDVRDEELRLALVLNGGVSLAVWMGGVAFELNRLVRETHPVYEGLLKLTGTAARIDVISGTSAGGINGAALALAQVHDRSLYSLRDVWLDTGSLERLLRDPDDENPTSLLQGDTWFLPQIRAAFAALATGGSTPAADAPLFLSLTTTLFEGHVDKRLDDFGATVEDTVHRALWRFERSEGPGNDAFAHARVVDNLAFAARSTASFPVAFEPASYRPDDKTYEAAPLLKVRLSPELDLRTPALLLDGGILDNRPFDAALDGIARLPAQGNTRRVVAYVAPDPAAAVERPKPPRPPGDKEEPAPLPTMSQIAWRSLVTIPAAQSIAANLARLREHNDDAMRRWQRIVGAMRYIGATELQGTAVAAFKAYQARRVDGIIDYLLVEIEGGLVTRGNDGVTDMRRTTRQWLRSTWRATRDDGTWAGRVPLEYPPKSPLLVPPDMHWPWGLYALEFAAELLVELLRRVQRLSGLIGGVSAVGSGADLPVEPIPAGPAGVGAVSWERLDEGRGAARRASDLGSTRLRGTDLLKEPWKAAYALAHKIRERRRRATDEAKDVGARGFVELVRVWRETGKSSGPKDEAHNLLVGLLALQPEVESANVDDAREVFQLVAELQPTMARIARQVEALQSTRAEIQEAASELDDIRSFLFDSIDGDPPDRPDVLARRILALEIFEVTASSRSHAPNVQAEVVQISGRQRSAWGGSDDPSAKLNGMQLGHFGAFYKRSWRANDWTFGRLDGIDRAIRIALNPDALLRRFGQRNIAVAGEAGPIKASLYVMRYLRALAVDSAEAEIRGMLESRWDAEATQIADELKWLDGEASLPPPVLEVCAAALTRRLQLEALRKELPEIATSLIAEREGGVAPSASGGIDLLARLAPDGRPMVPSAEHAAALVARNLLGPETLASQAGSDLYTRTVSHGLATAHAALSSRHGGLHALDIVFKVTEWPVRFLYLLTNRLSRGGSVAAALEGGALGVALVLVGGALLDQKLPSALIGFGWALLAGLVAAALLRQLLIGALMLALLLVAAVVLKSWAIVQLLFAVLFALAVLRTRWGAAIALVAAIVGAAWWGAGGSTDAAAVLWHEWVPGAGPVDGKMTVARDAAAQRLWRALAPALLLIALLGVSARSRALVARIRRDTSTSAWSETTSLLRRRVDRLQAQWIGPRRRD